ncbi:MAG: hypothetical protein F4080_09905 [Holophagales bacterium]|nr:hypothetical protein [Holophagales bacterium]
MTCSTTRVEGSAACRRSLSSWNTIFHPCGGRGWVTPRRPRSWPRWSWPAGWRRPNYPSEGLWATSPRSRATSICATPGSTRKRLGAIYVDVRGRIISEREHFVGGLDRTSVEPRAVLKEALRLGATAVVIFHNHPSGDPEPSPEDIAFTRRLGRAAAAVGVDLVDHLVPAGAGRWAPLRSRGWLSPPPPGGGRGVGPPRPQPGGTPSPIVSAAPGAMR